MKTVKCVLRKDKARKDGSCPVIIQIIANRQVSKVSVGFFCHPNDFDPEKGYVKKTSPEHEELNKKIKRAIATELNRLATGSNLEQMIVKEEERIDKKVKKAFKDDQVYVPETTVLSGEGRMLVEELNTLSRQMKIRERDEQALESEKDKAWTEYLKSKNKPSAEKVAGILKTFDEHVAQLRAEDSVGTATNYNGTRNKIAAFLNNKDIPINEINVQWLKTFDASMTKKKLAINTKYKHMKNLRKLLGVAYREGAILESPFKRFPLKTESVEKNFLTVSQVAQVESLELKGLMHQHRLFYLFSLYSGGLRVRDALQLQHKHIREGRLVLKTGKTGTDVGFKLLPQAMEILEYFRQLNPKPKPKPDDYIFPFLKPECQNMKADKLFKACSSSATMVNKSLAKIAKRLGLNHRMNFHSSRHTFAVLALSKGMRIEYISKVMGHKDIKVTQLYAKLIDRDVDDALGQAFGS